MFQVTFFSFIENKVSCPIYGRAWKRGSNFHFRVNHMAALDSSFISCTALDKTLDVRPPDTLIAERP